MSSLSLATRVWPQPWLPAEAGAPWGRRPIATAGQFLNVPATSVPEATAVALPFHLLPDSPRSKRIIVTNAAPSGAQPTFPADYEP